MRYREVESLCKGIVRRVHESSGRPCEMSVKTDGLPTVTVIVDEGHDGIIWIHSYIERGIFKIYVSQIHESGFGFEYVGGKEDPIELEEDLIDPDCELTQSMIADLILQKWVNVDKPKKCVPEWYVRLR